MKEYIEERAVAIANYIIDYNATVRQAAGNLGSVNLPCIKMWPSAFPISIRRLHPGRVWYWTSTKRNAISRGGMATKEKYEHEHQLRACSRDEK